MKIFGDNVLSLYICTQTIKGFYVYLLSSFYIGVRSFVKSTGSSFFVTSRVLISERFSWSETSYYPYILRIFDEWLKMKIWNADFFYWHWPSWHWQFPWERRTGDSSICRLKSFTMVRDTGWWLIWERHRRKFCSSIIIISRTMRTLLSVSIRKWLLSTGLQRMAGSWMTTAAALILPLSWSVMSAAWMKLRFRSSCPDIISGRPQAARSLQRKRSCRENSAVGVGPVVGNSDLSGKTASSSTEKLLILNNLSGKYTLSLNKFLGRRCGSPPSLRDSVRWRSDISRRRSCAPPSLRDFVR